MKTSSKLIMLSIITVVAVIAFSFSTKEKIKVQTLKKTDLIRIENPSRKTILSTHTQNHDKNQKSAATPDRQTASTAAIENDELPLILKKYSDSPWKTSLVNGRTNLIFGSKTKAGLTDSDAELQAFVSDVATTLVPDGSSVILDNSKTQQNNFELINDFSQQIEGINVYNSYFRTFRRAESLETTFLVNELTTYSGIESRVLFDNSDAVHKVKSYYSPFGREIEVSGCNTMVYFVKADKVAQLSYVCELTVFDTVPLVKELVISANSLEVLHQHTKTIVN